VIGYRPLWPGPGRRANRRKGVVSVGDEADKGNDDDRDDLRDHVIQADQLAEGPEQHRIQYHRRQRDPDVSGKAIDMAARLSEYEAILKDVVHRHRAGERDRGSRRLGDSREQALIDTDNSMTNAGLLIVTLLWLNVMLSLAKQRFPAFPRGPLVHIVLAAHLRVGET
jgi:hypothetical protein